MRMSSILGPFTHLPRAAMLVAAFSAFCPSLAASGEFTRSKYGGEFMNIGIGGRALGLGSAYTALASDITAGYWNPAGLSAMEYPQISLMHDERFAGLVNYDYAAVAVPFGPLSTVALSVIRLGVDNIPNTQNAGVDANGVPLSPDEWQNFARIDPSRVTYFNSADWAFYFSYARKLNDRFSYGGNLKFIRRDLGGASANGVGFDLGVRYIPMERLVIGANIQDVTSTIIAWSTGRNEMLTPTLNVGSAYFIDLLGGKLIPALEADVRFENRRYSSQLNIGSMSADFHGGLEYSFRGIAAVRAGYDDVGEWTLGAGIHLPKFDIDYSFAHFKDSEESTKTHRISLTFTLEASQFKRSGQ